MSLQPAGIAFSIPLKPDGRLSVSSVVLQHAGHKDWSGTLTAKYEKLNGKEKNPNKTKERTEEKYERKFVVTLLYLKLNVVE